MVVDPLETDLLTLHWVAATGRDPFVRAIGSVMVMGATHDEDDVVDVVDLRLSRRGLRLIDAAVLRSIVLTGLGIANAVTEFASGGRKLDLVGMPSAELMPLVGRISVSALSLKGMPQGKSATRSLTHSLHAAALAEEERGVVGDVDHAGLIIAVAFQCSQVQGFSGKGVDPEALAWARARVSDGGQIGRADVPVAPSS